MADALVTQLARALNLSPDAARHTLNHLVATLREQIEATGEAAVPGLGTFRWEDDRFVFTPDDALARAVNHRYAGLRPIGAGPAAARTAPRRPVPEPEDPFAAELPSAAAPSTEREEEPEAEFRPLGAFIEPGLGEETEPEATAPDVAAPDEEAVAAEHEPPAPEPPAYESAEEPEMPGLEDEAIWEDEPISEEESVSDEELVAEDESVPEGEPVEENEPVQEDEAEIDELLAGTWTSAYEPQDEEHALGPTPDDRMEDADYAVVEPDELELEGEPEPEVESEPSEAAYDEVASGTEPLEQDVEFDQDEVEEADLGEAPPAEDVPAALAADPPPVSEPPPVLKPEPAETRPVAPAFAATAAAAPPDRKPAGRQRRGNARLLIGAAVVLLGIVALLWFLNREPAGPTVAERQPAPADTAAAVLPPVAAPADTVAAGAPTDTAAVAEAPPATSPPASAPPEPSADPLRSSAGIDLEAGGWTWVVASEPDRATAEQRMSRYRADGLRVGVIPGEAGGRTRYRVGLGQFATTDEANRFRSDLPADVPEGTWLLQL